MFWWQWAAFVVAILLAGASLLCPPRGIPGRILHVTLAWIMPYILLTVAFCTAYLQSMWRAIPFFVIAYGLYACFIRRKT